MPLTLFPHLSSGGDQIHMPQTLGMTSRITPDTPDLAGSPTYNSNIYHTSETTKYLKLILAQISYVCKDTDVNKVNQSIKKSKFSMMKIP